MSYYENSNQWPAASQNTWEHQTPARTGSSGPSSQDDFAFCYQFDEVDRAYENLSKSGKGYGMGARREFAKAAPFVPRPNSGPMRPIVNDARMAAGPNPRSLGMGDFGDARGLPPSNLQNFYASQRHQPSRGSNEAEQVMQAKRRMAAQRERELRNLHTEQQYQRNVLSEAANYGPKVMSEEATRELIARQRSALYGEGAFADKAGYVDETGNVRPGLPTHSGPASLRGASPLGYEMGRGSVPPMASDAAGSLSNDAASGAQHGAPHDQGDQSNSRSSPQSMTGGKGVFEHAVQQGTNRTSSSSPGGSPPRQDGASGSKMGPPGAAVAPIGTRPSGTPATTTSVKRSTTPLASPGGWGRGNVVWGQTSGLGAQASVWG